MGFLMNHAGERVCFSVASAVPALLMSEGIPSTIPQT